LQLSSPNPFGFKRNLNAPQVRQMELKRRKHPYESLKSKQSSRDGTTYALAIFEASPCLIRAGILLFSINKFCDFKGTVGGVYLVQVSLLLIGQLGLGLILPTSTRINREKYTFCVIKSLEHLKNFKNGPVLYLSPKLTLYVIKGQIRLVKFFSWR
jgi:hypothetical protein